MGRQRIFEEPEASEYEQLAENAQTVEEDDSEDIQDDIIAEYMDETPRKRQKPINQAMSEVAYKLNSQESDIMTTAIQRLEQARLYDMFLKHNLFDGVKADATAKRKIEKELKGFILDRLQILLGIKQDQPTMQSMSVPQQFNEVEADALKALAFKMTKGESARAPTQMAVAQPTGMKPMASQPVNQLKPMSRQVEEEYEDDEDDEDDTPIQQPQRNKPQRAPQVQKQVKTRLTTAEELAMDDIKKMANRKSAYEMTAAELEAQNKKIKNNKSGKSSKAIPMPNAEQQQMHYMMQAQTNQQALSTNGLVNLLSQKMGFSTTSIENVGDDE